MPYQAADFFMVWYYTLLNKEKAVYIKLLPRGGSNYALNVIFIFIFQGIRLFTIENRSTVSKVYLIGFESKWSSG